LPGFTHEVVPDAIETVTFLCIAAFLRSSIRLCGLPQARTLPGIAKEMALLGSMGVESEWSGEELQVKASDPLRGIDITVESHGIFSDSQPFFALLSTTACSPS